MLAALRPSDSASLCRAITGQEYQTQGGRGYIYDDGAWLTYVLTLSGFSDETYSLPQMHALWEAVSIWLDVSANNSKQLALEAGEVADRFIAQAKMTEAQRQAMTVCVQQAEADPVVRRVLETRFGKVRYGVTVSAFLCGRAGAKVVALEEIFHNSAVPGLIADLKDKDSDVRREAVKALGKIGDKSAVPALIAALIAALEDSRYSVSSDTQTRAAEALVKIGKPAVPALSKALKDRNSHVREAVVGALEKIGDVSAVHALEAADREYHSKYYCKFCDALRRLGAK